VLNHVRTLLRNVSGRQQQQLLSPLAEPVDPAFRARRLPPWLQVAHHGLFGTQPDTFYLDYRTREILNLIAGTALADVLTARDTRITEEFLAAASIPTMTPNIANDADSATHTLNCSNSPDADDLRGRAWYHYTVAIASSVLTLTTDSGDAYQTAPVNGVYRITAPNGMRLTVAPTTGSATWRVYGYSRPRGLYVALRDFEQQAGPWFDELISPQTGNAELQACREIWTRRPAADFPNRMAALVLATALYIETLPEKPV